VGVGGVLKEKEGGEKRKIRPKIKSNIPPNISDNKIMGKGSKVQLPKEYRNWSPKE